MVPTSRDLAELNRTTNTIVSSVAEAKGVSPGELDPPLYDAVDPDALERLFETGGPPGEPPSVVVRFTYCGFDVRVTASTVSVSEAVESTSGV